MYREDIEGSMAHAAMLSRQGIITEEDGRQIRLGLRSILKDMDAGVISLTPEQYEDIHMANEQLLTERIGEAGKRLHTARSRNDQVALDLRLYVRREIGEIGGQITELLEELCTLAEANAETVMPGYTHLQRAQPITFGHHLMAYANMFRRDAKRLENCLEGMDELPLGCGALAGTTYPIDREFAAGELGFSRVTDNSLDGVSDRDYCMELCGCLSILMVHLSRLSEEIILWCSWEFKFVELDDAFSTGSSIMPQKKNPDVCELIRGKAGRVFGGPSDSAGDDEGAAPGLQQGYAGGQGGGVRRHRHGEGLPGGAHPHDGHHNGAAGQYEGGGQEGIFERHRLRRLPDEEGASLPGCLPDGGGSWWPFALRPATCWTICPWTSTRRSAPCLRRTYTRPSI